MEHPEGGAAQVFQEVTTAAGQFANKLFITAPDVNNFFNTVTSLMHPYGCDPSVQLLNPALYLLRDTVSPLTGAPIAPQLQVYARMIANCISQMTYNPNTNRQNDGRVSIHMLIMTRNMTLDSIPLLIQRLHTVILEYPNDPTAQAMLPILNFLKVMYEDHQEHPSDQSADWMLQQIFNAIPSGV